MMSSFINSPAIQFLIVVVIVCVIAICACICLERTVAHFFPITDMDINRVLYHAPTNVATIPMVTIHIDPATDVETGDEIQQAEVVETPILH